MNRPTRRVVGMLRRAAAERSAARRLRAAPSWSGRRDRRGSPRLHGPGHLSRHRGRGRGHAANHFSTAPEHERPRSARPGPASSRPTTIADRAPRPQDRLNLTSRARRRDRVQTRAEFAAPPAADAAWPPEPEPADVTPRPRSRSTRAECQECARFGRCRGDGPSARDLKVKPSRPDAAAVQGRIDPPRHRAHGSHGLRRHADAVVPPAPGRRRAVGPRALRGVARRTARAHAGRARRSARRPDALAPASLVMGGLAAGPPNPPTLGAPRRSRGAPRNTGHAPR